MNNTNTPMAQVKVQVRPLAGGDWRDALEFAPVGVPVEDSYLTDVFNPTVIGLVDAIWAADSQTAGPNNAMRFEYNVVWSDSGYTVKGTCPVCDDVFPIAEGAPGDELNEGYDALWCGCDPADLD
jgi:hypothetical protein